LKFLITGGYGFIGSNFLHTLRQKYPKADILNIDKLTYAASTENANKENLNFEFVKEDICNFEEVNKVVGDFKPNYIIHFAAESHVSNSIHTPTEFIQTNVLGTSCLLEATRDLTSNWMGFRKFIHISTDEVYGELGKEGSFTLETPFRPTSPYASSKAASDLLVKSWGKTYDLPVIVTNCTNNYGPRQHEEKLIPKLIINSLKGELLPIHGTGSNVRDWLYVEDHCEAIIKVIEKGVLHQTYHIGGGIELSSLQVAKFITHELAKYLAVDENNFQELKDHFDSLISFIPDRLVNDQRYSLDCTKTIKELKWSPKITSFNLGLEKTFEWYTRKN
jgi:dTDP-glucose 4,6-dehydratase